MKFIKMLGPGLLFAGAAVGEVWVEDLAFAEGLVAVAFFYHSRIVDDGGFASHGIAEGVAAFIKGVVSGGVSVAEDEVVATSRSVDVSP